MTELRNRCSCCGSPITTAGHHIPTPPLFPLDAEQLVRGAGFFAGLVIARLQKPGESIPTAERLTLDLGEAMGVPLPTKDGTIAFVAGGQQVKTTLLPYGAVPQPAVRDPEIV